MRSALFPCVYNYLQTTFEQKIWSLVISTPGNMEIRSPRIPSNRALLGLEPGENVGGWATTTIRRQNHRNPILLCIHRNTLASRQLWRSGVPIVNLGFL